MSLPASPDGGTKFGRYRLLDQIGSGGMAVVYRAMTEGTDGASRPVVIKRVLPELSRDPGFSAMLLAEARLSSRLNHPNIVRVYELGRVGEEYYLAMEHVDGLDLVRLLNLCHAAQRPPTVGMVCYMIAEVAAALAYAHDLRDNEERPLAIVHRDVSLSNVMVTRTGAIKLLDFGVAKAAEHVKNERTRTGTLKGKINYLSPEQAEGLPIDRRADIFALGIVFHECLTMRRLFKADGDLATLRLVREAKVAPPSSHRPEIEPELDRLVLKMLARDPATRYQTCAELITELKPIVAKLGGDAAGMALLVESLPDEPSPIMAPVVVELEMDSGPTPLVDVAELEGPDALTRPGSVQRRNRRLLWAGAATAVLAASIGLVAAGGSMKHPPLAIAPAASPPAAASPPTAPVAAPAPAPVAPTLLSIDTDVAAARITLDGKVVANAVPRARITLDHGGEHALVVTAPHRRPFRRTVTVRDGETINVAVKLERPTATAATKRGHGENYLVNPFGAR